MKCQLITPAVGTTYLNRNGQQYLCLRVIDPEHAIMERLTDRWTLTACRTWQFEDGSIEWDRSIDCYWPGGRPSHG